MIVKDKKLNISFGQFLKEDLDLWKSRNNGAEFDSRFKLEGNYISFVVLQAFHDYKVAIECNLHNSSINRYTLFTVIDGKVYENKLVTGDRFALCLMLKVSLMLDSKFKDKSLKVLEDVIKILLLGVEKDNMQKEVVEEVEAINEVLDIAYEDYYKGIRGDEILSCYLVSCSSLMNKSIFEEIEYCVMG